MPRFPAAAARPFRLNRRGVLGAFAGGAAALALGPRSAAARLPEDVLREITARALDREILPAHAALSAAARRLAAAAATCPVEDRAGLDAAYHATFDAWMGVSHLRFGPAEAEGRALAIAFWPDRKGFARRALDGLIADQDPAVDDPARFHEVSVAARGLMALDRLLFDAQAPDAGRGYPCRLVAAIGRDLAATSAALEADWAETHAPDMRVAGTEAARLYLHAEEPVRDLFAALLTGAVRASLPTAPAFAMDAPVQGSGKTLLACCAAALCGGRAPEIWPHTAGRDDEEVRKRLLSALRVGPPALIWDNVVGALDSAALAAAITAPIFTDRLLGRSETISVPNRTLLLMTGNNIHLAGDLPRRVLVCRIDPETDVPFARRFDLDPLAHVLEHRMELVVAALTLIRGRLCATSPKADGRMASFELWDDLVRQTVCWIGCDVAPGEVDDPMALVHAAQANDPEQESLAASPSVVPTPVPPWLRPHR